jgi:hypothetical protein
MWENHKPKIIKHWFHYIPVRGLQSAAVPSCNGGWAASVLGPLITGAQLELNIVPAFPHSESDVIHLLKKQCLLSRTVNKGFKAIQTMTKLHKP